MIHLLVLSLKEQVYSGSVEKVIAPGTDGQFSILPNHLPFLTTLSQGALVYFVSGSEKYLEIPRGGGIFELVNNRATILLATS